MELRKDMEPYRLWKTFRGHGICVAFILVSENAMYHFLSPISFNVKG